MLQKLILLFMSVSLVFGSAGSTERSRFLGTEFIDIGKRDTIGDTTIAQQFVNLPAKTKLLEEIVDYKPRSYETYKCKIDDEGGETCPKDITDCNANPEYTAGYSVKKSGTYTQTAGYVMGWVNQATSNTARFSTDHWVNVFFVWNPTAKQIQALLIGGSPSDVVEHNIGSWEKASTVVTVDNPTVKNGEIVFSMRFWGERCVTGSGQYTINTNTLQKTNRALSKEELFQMALNKGFVTTFNSWARRWHKTSRTSNPGAGYFSRIGVCPGGGVQTPNIQLQTQGEQTPVCPEGYTYTASKDKCVKTVNYVYYDYKCPAATNEINPLTGKIYPAWIGPKVKGGDCGGVGLNSAKECQSATPPRDNCFRNFYYCPFDPKRTCFKNPTNEKPVVENQDGGYVYAAPTANTISKILFETPKCPSGGTFNKDKLQCEAIVKATCPAGFTESPYDGICVKKLEEKCIEEANGQCIKKAYENCDGTLSQTQDGLPAICYANKIQQCPSEYVGDSDTKCLAETKCPTGFILTPEGKCEQKYFYTEYQCPAGYENVKPQSSGSNDCKGICGFDTCSCNSAIPQADTCRKKVAPQTNKLEIVEKSKLLRHSVTLSKDYKAPKENFKITNIPCSIDVNGGNTTCKDNVVSIIGKDNQLCFNKANGQNYCYDVLGCSFSGSITSDRIKDISVGRDLKTLSSATGSGSIKSTCRFNGNVGNKNRTEGISLVSSNPTNPKYVTIKAKGSARTSNGNWNGFSLANMAIQLSDGLWYAVDQVFDSNGNKVVRNMPDFVVGIDKSAFNIVKANSACEVKGKKTPGYCGDEILMYMPSPDLGIIGVAELDGLNPSVDKSKNSVSLNVTFNDTLIPLTTNIANISSNPYVVRPVESEIEFSDKLHFWDNYMDGDIGFIEFVREISAEDKRDGFVPENKIPFEMAEKGFTNIEYSKGNDSLEPWVPGKTEELKTVSTAIIDWVIPYALGMPVNRHLTIPGMSETQFREALCRGSSINPAVYLVDFNTRQRLPITAYDELMEAQTIYVGSPSAHWLTNSISRCALNNDSLRKYGHKLKCKKTLCPIEGYVLTNELDKDGNKICKFVNTTCPTGYFATGEKGEKACKKTITKGTYFVAPKMSAGECRTNANLVGGVVIPSEMFKFNLLHNGKHLSSTGATRESCVIRVDSEADFASVEYAEKSKLYDNNFKYVCSKWSCENGNCKIGICPTIRKQIGNTSKPVEYQGKIIPDSLRETLSSAACLEQSCDAFKEYGNVCGLRYQPSTNLGKGVFFKDGKFYQAYCDDKEAALSEDGSTCVVKRCPEGTVKQANGTCKKTK